MTHPTATSRDLVTTLLGDDVAPVQLRTATGYRLAGLVAGRVVPLAFTSSEPDPALELVEPAAASSRKSGDGGHGTLCP